ncbi:hypothetical protein [Desulfoluna sp.]|uniref:hypothetical protein n=1 Tax=Desulfoluna sp. TaxID=2045199 RepID=UPI0026151C12|nr:hypothetical protein [Desulfoluna sp.]
MKRLIPVLMVTSLVLTGCVTSSPVKTRTDRSAVQRERARQAFDELEGRPSSPAPAAVTAPVQPPRPDMSKTPAPAPAQTPVTIVADFSASTHLIARGYGQSRPEAIRRAKAELSNTFKSRIQSDISSVTRAVTDSAKGNSLYKNVQAKIRIASTIELEGVEVGPVVKDGREYVADVALNREQAARKWRNDIARISARIAVEQNAAKTSPGKLMKLKHLNKAMNLFIEREALISRLQVIGRPAEQTDQREFETLVATLQEIKTNFRISLNVKSPKGKDLSHKLARELTEAGFIVGNQPSDSDVILQVALALSRVKTNDPNFKFMRATADVSIIDPVTGKTVGNFNENKRSGHLSYEEAGAKATRSLSGKLAQKIIAYLN